MSPDDIHVNVALRPLPCPFTAQVIAGEDRDLFTAEQMRAYGMSLRDYFAGLALQGFLANKANPLRFNASDDAAWAYAIADAMLAARAAK